jgi:tripartite ATP-independent transporter DctM subunit
MNPLLVLLGSFFLMVAIKIPIAFAMAISSLLVIIQLDLPFMSVVNQMFAGINSFPLLAVPFFMLLGQLMNSGGITQRLVNVSNVWVGHIRGGLGHVNVMVSMLFAGLSGSAAADTAGIGSIMIPTMLQSGFDKPFTVAITAASSTLGVIIPPSIMMVIYGALAQISIGALFWSGVVPGVLIGLAQMFYCYYRARKYHYPRCEKASWGEKAKVTFQAIPPLLLPLLILGGITAGVYTATEAAAIAVAYGFVLVLTAYRDIKWKDLPRLFANAAISYALPMFCVSAAGIMGWLISYMDVPEMISKSILNITTSYYGVYAMIILALLIVGTFLSPIASIIIFLPIIQALGEAARLDPIHLGLIVNLTLALGMVTPPYGICLLIGSQIGKISAPKAFVAILPMFYLALGIIVAGVIWPDLFLFLPKLVMPGSFK